MLELLKLNVMVKDDLESKRSIQFFYFNTALKAEIHDIGVS